MTKEEYINKMNDGTDWAPGWDAVEDEFKRLYPGQEPKHYATLMPSRAIFGGDEYLDGVSIYTNGKAYQHLVTFGMTSLYADPDSFGGEYSGWGYEMTMKLKEDTPEDCMWAVNMLANLARYTYKSNRFFEPEQYIQGNGESIHSGTDSLITSLITINDTTAETKDSLHGKVEFIQLVGITESELNAIKNDRNNIRKLVELMRNDDPEMITDMNRNFSYL